MAEGVLVELERVPESVAPARSVEMIWAKSCEHYRLASAFRQHLGEYAADMRERQL